MFKLESNNLTPSLDKKMKELEKIPNGAFEIFRSHTPIKTGNARSKTRLKQETIRADYSYAKPLEQGRSRQAPDGMSKPTKSWMKKSVDRIMKRK